MLKGAKRVPVSLVYAIRQVSELRIAVQYARSCVRIVGNSLFKSIERVEFLFGPDKFNEFNLHVVPVQINIAIQCMHFEQQSASADGWSFTKIGDRRIGLPGGVVVRDHSEHTCLLYTSPSPRDQRGSRMPSSA